MLKSFAGRLAVVFALLIGGLSLAGGAGVSAQTVVDVEVRDRLIADQEALLNTYRCMFGVDVEVVPGGCSSGAPSLPAKDPAPFSGTPSPSDITVRDELVAAQEALLNTYRCRFQIDTQQVPGGCPEPTDQTDEETVAGTEGAILRYSCDREDLGFLSWCQMSEGDWRAVDRHLNICDTGQYTIFSETGSICGPYDPNFDPHRYTCGPIVETTHIASGYVYDHSRNAYPTTNTAGGCRGEPNSKWWFGPTRIYPEVGGQCNARDIHFGRMFEVCVPAETLAEELKPWQYRAFHSFTSHIRSVMSDDEIAELSEEEFQRLLNAYIRDIEENAKRPYYNLDLPFVRGWCEAHSTEEYDQNIVQGFCSSLGGSG